MARAGAAEQGRAGDGRGEAAAVASPSPAPLRLVHAALSGHDFPALARQAAEGCGRAVALTLPAHGPTVLWPASGAHPSLLAGLFAYASTVVAGRAAVLPDGVGEAVAVEVGAETVGVVAALGPGPAEIAVGPWLEAAAAAAAVATVMRESAAKDGAGARASFLEGLEATRPTDLPGFLDHARRLGVDLSHGAVGLCALAGEVGVIDRLPAGVLVAEVGAQRLLGLLPLGGEGGENRSAAIVAELGMDGAVAACSSPRASPALLQDALVEAAVLAELALAGGHRPDPSLARAVSLDAAQQETYRLLIGVLLRAPEELARLRTRTIAELERYDALHDTELVATLQVFLARHGSTTETAETMRLHRHTVGYRLARVQEVSGLSPYESDGRERLSLGLKADRVLAAEAQRVARSRSR